MQPWAAFQLRMKCVSATFTITRQQTWSCARAQFQKKLYLIISKTWERKRREWNWFDDLFYFFPHRIESQNIDVSKGRFANYKSIEWTPQRVENLYKMYTEAPVSMQCNRSDGNRFEGFNWEDAPITKIPTQTPRTPKACGKSLQMSEDCGWFGECYY